MDEPTSSAPGVGTVTPAALDALLAVLRPLARVAIDQGVQFGQLEELLKRAMVEAALRATAGDTRRAAPPVSRLSVVTGIHRKEVKRLTEHPGLETVPAEPTPAAELFTRWMTDPAWRDADGPRALPRRPATDGAPSFEQLARTVTTDVHPRTLLDELLRLELASVDAASDTVRLRGESYVPAARLDGMLGFLGANVGDHLAAAAANVTASLRAARDPASTPARPPFVEQALFADALSPAAAAVAAERAREFWGTLLRALAPELQALEDADRAAGHAADQRIRIGLYCYSEPMPPAAPAASSIRHPR
jgi:hypothetical protein